MSTAYERGYRDGIWTLQQVKQCGWKTPRECLAHEEKNYAYEVAHAPNQQHIEYMNEIGRAHV